MDNQKSRNQIIILNAKLAESQASWKKYANTRSRGSIRQGDVKSQNIRNQIKAQQNNLKQNNNIITYFEEQKDRVQKNHATANSGSFATGDDSRKTTIKPPLPASQSISGYGIASNNFNSIKQFLGIGNKPKQPKPPQVKQQTGKPHGRLSAQDFKPTQYETGTIGFSNEKVGYNPNYFSTKDNQQTKSQKTVLPSGQVIEITQKRKNPEPKKPRQILCWG